MSATIREMTFRAAESRDISAIVALVESAFRGDVSRKGWTTEADFLDGQRTDPLGVAALIDSPGCRIVLAEHDGELLACAHIEKHGNATHFGMFSVRPDLQGAGVGKAMMAEAERIARDEWRSRAMEMNVINVRAELIAWYERHGYRRTGIHSPFPYGDQRFGIPKRDDLRFEQMVKPL